MIYLSDPTSTNELIKKILVDLELSLGISWHSWNHVQLLFYLGGCRSWTQVGGWIGYCGVVGRRWVLCMWEQSGSTSSYAERRIRMYLTIICDEDGKNWESGCQEEHCKVKFWVVFFCSTGLTGFIQKYLCNRQIPTCILSIGMLCNILVWEANAIITRLIQMIVFYYPLLYHNWTCSSKENVFAFPAEIKYSS